MSAPRNTSGVSQADSSEPTVHMPPESVRTLVTLLLLFHLFIAVVAAISSSRAYSELVGRLVDRLVAQLHYPDLLGLRSYSYELTYGRDLDYEGTAEVVLDWEEGDEGRTDRVESKRSLVFLDSGEVKLPIRRHRYLSFIRNMSERATAEPPSPLEVEMPMAVSRALLGEADVPDGRHRFRLWRIPTQRPEFLDDQRTPPVDAIYEGNIIVRDGKFEFTKADRAAASSPVVPANSPSSTPDRLPPIGAPPFQPTDDPLPNRGPLGPPFENPARSNGNR